MKKLVLCAAIAVSSGCSSGHQEQVGQLNSRKISEAPAEKYAPRKVVPISDEIEFEALDIVRASLKDPGAANFQRVFGTSIHPGLPKATVVCGFVNAKNGYGGYTGFRMFAVIGGHSYIWSDEASGFGGADNDFIQQICTEDTP